MYGEERPNNMKAIRICLFQVLIIFGAIALCLPSAIRAYSKPNDSTISALSPEQRVDLRLAHAKHVLHLSDMQASQMRTILLAHEVELQADRVSLESTVPGTMERKAARQKLLADMRGMNSELKPILTPRQLVKWRKLLVRELRRRERQLLRQQTEMHR
jgi:hypothetical protein